MPKYQVKFTNLSGAFDSATVPAEDPACALGVVLDEQDVDSDEPITIGLKVSVAKRSAPKVRIAKVVPIRRAKPVDPTPLEPVDPDLAEMLKNLMP